MTTVYEANNELAEILFKQGFIETTSKIDRLKGKKSFKLSKFAQKEIYFDYINIRVENSNRVMDSKLKITEKELKYILLYFKLSSIDFKEFSSNGNFDCNKMEEKLVYLYKDLEKLKEYNLQKSRQNKIERILKIYESITI